MFALKKNCVHAATGEFSFKMYVFIPLLRHIYHNLI